MALPTPPQGAKLAVTRVGHPARIIPHEGALNSTLEAQAERSDEVRSIRVLSVGASNFFVRPLWQET